MTTKRVLAHLQKVSVETKIGRTALILSAAMAATTPALAADMKGDYGSRTVGSYPAVPVPAPIPIPETFQWYVRGDAGYSLKTTGSLTNTGTPQVDLAEPEGQRGLFSGSFAFGRYVTPSLRVEFGIDVRSQQTIGRPKNYTMTKTSTGVLAVDPVTDIADIPTTDTNTYAVDRQDNTSSASHTLMANVYYDLKTGGVFTPYVGAGAGLSIAQMKRTHSESAVCTQSVNSNAGQDETQNIVVDPFTGERTRVCGASGARAYNSVEGSKGITAYGPALALMAGTAVQLRPGVSLDAGYRLMWQGSTPSISAGSVTGDISKITQGSRTDHELRMGVRWDLW